MVHNSILIVIIILSYHLGFDNGLAIRTHDQNTRPE